MNKYFCFVGRDLVGKIDKFPNPLLSCDYGINPLSSTLVFNSIQAQHASEAIGKTESSKSFANESISSYFLKLAFPYVRNSLAFLFSTSMESIQFLRTTSHYKSRTQNREEAEGQLLSAPLLLVRHTLNTGEQQLGLILVFNPDQSC